MGSENNQKSQIVLKCRSCKNNCRIVYDRHRDEHFSVCCGKVVMQGGFWLVHDYDPDVKWITIKGGLFY
jgi:hypothetical protein